MELLTIPLLAGACALLLGGPAGLTDGACSPSDGGPLPGLEADLSQVAGPSALGTDLYQLTMAQGFFRAGMADRQVAYHLFFRRAPFGNAFAVAAGLEPALERIERWSLTGPDLDYLRTLKDPSGQPLFQEEFLSRLAGTRLEVDVEAVPEGSLVLPGEPLLRVTGPAWQAQLVETLLLNELNFETLIATKAARIRLAAGADTVMEFGLRRAHGPDGGLSASRAAFVGGVDATSNVEAGQRFGIPVRGTHAHSWVMLFGDEQAAFEAWCDANPGNCTLLVDTHHTLQGVAHAIAAGRRARSRGSDLSGIRLDSGDLDSLSRQARALLDQAGFQSTRIIASGDLDEETIARLKAAGAPIDVWGVGTRLATGHPDGALGGVYKLSAVQEGGEWTGRFKRSDDPGKSTLPGLLQVRRWVKAGRFRDRTFDPRGGVEAPEGVAGWEAHDLLEPVMRAGRRVRPAPSLIEVRARMLEALRGLAGIEGDVDPRLIEERDGAR